MAIHRAITTSGSAADARIRSNTIPSRQSSYYNTCTYENDSPHYETPNHIDADANSELKIDHQHQIQSSIQGNGSGNDKNGNATPTRTTTTTTTTTKYPSICYDPTRPLLPTTRVYTLSPTAISFRSQMYEGEVSKSMSGTYIGLICIVLVWLFPICIIISGGTAGDVVSMISDLQFPITLPSWSNENTSTRFGLIASHQLDQEQEQERKQGHEEEQDRQPLIPSTPLPSFWESMKRSEHCLRYKTREYTAKSVGAGRGVTGLENCRKATVEIHGIEMVPTFCEDLGIWSGIWAHWVVDFDEPDCETYWVNFADEGCRQVTGDRALSARLKGFKGEDNWQIMCSTTPLRYRVNGERLSVPSYCEKLKDGVAGKWFVKNSTCVDV